MSKKKRPEKILIVWRDDSGIRTLAYDGGGGKIRCYYRDRYDSRCDGGKDELLPFFDDANEAVHHLGVNPGVPGQCQVTLQVASEMEWFKGETISEVVLPLNRMAAG